MAMTSRRAMRPIGWTEAGVPVYPIQGARITVTASPDDDETGDEGDDDDEEQEQEQERPARRTRREAHSQDDEEDYVPPTREEWERIQAAMRRNNGEMKRRRLIGQELESLGINEGGLADWLRERGIDPASGEPLGPGGQQDRDQDQDTQQDESRRTDRREREPVDRRSIQAAEERGAAKASAAMQVILVQQAAKAELLTAGWSGANMNLALKMIDVNDVEYDPDSGDFIGLAEQIETIKTELPQLFRRNLVERNRSNGNGSSDEAVPRRRRAGAERVDGGDRGRAPQRPRTWEQRIADELMR